MLCPVLWPLVQGPPAPYRSPVHYRRVLAHSWKRGCIPRLPSRRVWRSFLCPPLFPLHQQFLNCCFTSCSRSTALERPFHPPVRFLSFLVLPVSPSWTSRVPLTSALFDRSAPVLDSASAVPSLRSKPQSQCRRSNYSLASTFLPSMRYAAPCVSGENVNHIDCLGRMFRRSFDATVQANTAPIEADLYDMVFPLNSSRRSRQQHGFYRRTPVNCAYCRWPVSWPIRLGWLRPARCGSKSVSLAMSKCVSVFGPNRPLADARGVLARGRVSTRSISLTMSGKPLCVRTGRRAT